MAWTLQFAPQAIRALVRLDPKVARRIRRKLDDLARDPTAPNNNVKRLSGRDAYRLRIGDWRVVYQLRRSEIVILVIRIGHRSEVYRD